MNYLISLIIGAITSVMILQNGKLSDTYGNFASSIIIHIVGLLTIIPVLVLSKSKFKLKAGIPLYLYGAGFIGVATVLFTNLSFAALGVSLTQALGLLGQTVASIIIDHFGLMGMKPVKFKSKKSIGLFLISFGILIMAIY